MTRGEIILHVCMHGTCHRGNAGLLLQKNGIRPNDDRMTDFLEQHARKPTVGQSSGTQAPEAKNPA